MTAMHVGVAGVGMLAPGIPNWDDGRRRLADGGSYDLAAPFPKMAAEILPANERRRVTEHIKLALSCGTEALSGGTVPASQVATVFASSGGDLYIVDKILKSLGEPGKPVSPTHFHNSVHNAAAGYWSIAASSRSPSISISAHDGSFAAGLVEAVTQLAVEHRPVLLVAADTVSPPLIHPFRPLAASFGVALLLVPEKTEVTLGVETRNAQAATTMDNAEFERLRGGNPAARSLPLLRQFALRRAGTIHIPYLEGLGLKVEVMMQ